MTIKTLALSMLLFFGIVGTVWAHDAQSSDQPNDSQNSNVGNLDIPTPTCTPAGGIPVSESVQAGQSATVAPTSQPTPTGIVLPIAPPQTGR